MYRSINVAPNCYCNYVIKDTQTKSTLRSYIERFYMSNMHYYYNYYCITRTWELWYIFVCIITLLYIE